MAKLDILCHRGLWEKPEDQNTLKSYRKAFELGFGIELDIRDYNSKIVISHDFPNEDPILFSDLLEQIKHYKININHLAINIKADGLAVEILNLINSYDISNYFTFDMSIPEMVSYKNIGLKYFSRLSEFEKNPVLFDDSLGIWGDAFEREWYDYHYINNLMKTKKQICFVSAELHNRDHTSQWAIIKEINNQNKLMLCTDMPNEAKEYFR